MNKYLLILLLQFFPFLSWSQSLYLKVDSIRRQYHLPEIGCVIISGEKIIDLAVCGYHRIDKPDKEDTARLTDHFHLGSNTKAITGFIAATLVEQGKIQWNTKFFDLYPELKKDADTAYYNITLQQLLSHRAHIQPFTSGAEKLKVPIINGTNSAQRLELARYVLKQKPIYPNKKKDYDYSGTGYVYSNAGYAVASLMLEKAGGKSWEELATSLMNDQLHLNIAFGWPNKTDSMQPWGHEEVNGTLNPLPGNISYNLSMLEPAGDMNMPLPDYAKFIQLQLQGLRGKDTVIKASTYQLLHFGEKEYAIGWLNGLNKSGNKYSAHEGSAGTFHVITIINPESDRAYIICFNAANDNADKAKEALLKYFKDRYAPTAQK